MILPVTPDTNSIGVNAAIVVSTPKITGTMTSYVPRIAALVPLPVRVCVLWMFSPTTIASSTTMPSTRMNANSDIMLIETSNTGISAIEPRKDTGMPSVTHSASRRRRNSASTTNTIAKPVIALLASRSIRLLSTLAESSQVAMLIPGGAVAENRST